MNKAALKIKEIGSSSKMLKVVIAYTLFVLLEVFFAFTESASSLYGNSSIIFNVISYALPVVTCIGMWMIYNSAKQDVAISRKGFSVVKIVANINLVLTCIGCAVIFIISAIIAALADNVLTYIKSLPDAKKAYDELLSSEEFASLNITDSMFSDTIKVIAIVIAIVVVIVAVIMIIYYLKIIKTIKSIRSNVDGNEINDYVSSYFTTILLVSAICNGISAAMDLMDFDLSFLVSLCGCIYSVFLIQLLKEYKAAMTEIMYYNNSDENTTGYNSIDSYGDDYFAQNSSAENTIFDEK